MAEYSTVRKLANHLYGSTLSGKCTEAEVVNAERGLSMRFPRILRDFYLDIGCGGPLGTTQECLLPPDELEVRDDALVFCIENQGVRVWGLRLSDLGLDDPPVMSARNEPPLRWEPDHTCLSDFWVTFMYWQAVNGALGTVGVCIDAPDSVFAHVEQRWPEIELGANHWTTRFFGNDDQIICFVGGRQLHAAATSGDGLRAIQALTVDLIGKRERSSL